MNRLESALLLALIGRTEAISGEALASRLGVTRSACWKQIQEYRHRGLIIESGRRGYKLTNWEETLKPARLKCLLSSAFPESVPYIKLFDSLDSTNLEAKRLGNGDAPDYTVVVSRTQTQGRGRMGKSWESAEDGGLYCSILLRPRLTPQAVMPLTLACGLAAARTLDELLPDKTGIKWPNDVLAGHRKISGILCESALEDVGIHHLVVGIGINVNQVSYSPELKDKAVSIRQLTGQPMDPNYVLVRLLYHFSILWKRFVSASGSFEPFRNEYISACVTLGQEVVLTQGGETIRGRAVSVDRSGDLVLELPDGREVRAAAGEAHVRGLLGYA